MKKEITKEAVKKLKPAKRPYEIYDAALRNFVLRLQPSGVKDLPCYCSFWRKSQAHHHWSSISALAGERQKQGKKGSGQIRS